MRLNYTLTKSPCFFSQHTPSVVQIYVIFLCLFDRWGKILEMPCWWQISFCWLWLSNKYIISFFFSFYWSCNVKNKKYWWAEVIQFLHNGVKVPIKSHFNSIIRTEPLFVGSWGALATLEWVMGGEVSQKGTKREIDNLLVITLESNSIV